MRVIISSKNVLKEVCPCTLVIPANCWEVEQKKKKKKWLKIQVCILALFCDLGHHTWSFPVPWAVVECSSCKRSDSLAALWSLTRESQHSPLSFLSYSTAHTNWIFILLLLYLATAACSKPFLPLHYAVRSGKNQDAGGTCRKKETSDFASWQQRVP